MSVSAEHRAARRALRRKGALHQYFGAITPGTKAAAFERCAALGLVCRGKSGKGCVSGGGGVTAEPLVDGQCRQCRGVVTRGLVDVPRHTPPEKRRVGARKRDRS